MDLWTARLWASRAVLPWITTRPLPTAPPSDHNSTDPQAARSDFLELINACVGTRSTIVTSQLCYLGGVEVGQGGVSGAHVPADVNVNVQTRHR